MAIERTFAIIKPDAVAAGQQGDILARIHKAGFAVVAIKSMRLTKEEAGGFYAVHKARPFFGELTEFMSSGKIIALVLEAVWAAVPHYVSLAPSPRAALALVRRFGELMHVDVDLDELDQLELTVGDDGERAHS